MKNILDKIVLERRKRVAQLKLRIPVASFEEASFFNKPTQSLKDRLEDGNTSGIIAEFKRASPSKGIINNTADVLQVTEAYEKFGAAGISILTEPQFFEGSSEDLRQAAAVRNLPLLRKDFIVDEYQLFEARAMGADVILLIAACLSKEEVKTLAKTAKSLGLEVLLELHEEAELDHICDNIDLVGVNNRNLKTFEVNLDHSILLAEQIGKGLTKIAESGINRIENILLLQQHGFKGFLIGEHFMKTKDPAASFQQFSAELKQANEN